MGLKTGPSVKMLTAHGTHTLWWVGGGVGGDNMAAWWCSPMAHGRAAFALASS